jgi:CHAT domain-containing protein
VEAFEQALRLCSVPQSSPELAWSDSGGHAWNLGTPEDARPIVLDLASYLEDRGELHRAREFFKLAVEMAEIARARVATPVMRDTVQDERALAFQGLVRLTLGNSVSDAEQSAIDAAWAVAEHWRARSFLDAVGLVDMRFPSGLPRELQDGERQLLRERASAERARVLDFDRLRDVSARLEQVWGQISRTSPEGAEYVRIRRAQPASGAEVIQALHGLAGRERPVLASFVSIGEQNLALFTVRPDEGHIQVWPLSVDARRLASFLDVAFTGGRLREMTPHLEESFHAELDSLIAPLDRASRPDETIVFCPTGLLQNIPLHALALAGGTLIERNPVAYVPSGSLVRTIALRANTADSAALVLGDPDGDLPGARDEAVEVARLLGTEPVLGAAATRRLLIDRLNSVSVLHSAGHAFFDSVNPMMSGLRLSDGPLTAQEMLGLPLNHLRLAFLSGCETGVRQANRADEASGLVRALLFTGVRSLVLSLWRVNDAATRYLVIRFYELLRDGVSAARALQRSMLETRRLSGWERADYWAPFVLVGDWR